MATRQTINHFRKFKDELKGPYLEIGSLVTPAYHQHLPREIHDAVQGEYIGVDIFPGEGVDCIANLCKDEEVAKLPLDRFKTIHCHYVMEHVTDIFSMARNMEKLLDEDGVLLFSVPFVWRIHRIPVDMWRFTPQSIDYLFPNIEFINDKCAVSLRNGDETYDVNKIPEFNLGSQLNEYPAYIKWYVRILRKLGLDNNLFNQRALMLESNLMMYGVKRKTPTYTFIDPKFCQD